MGEGLLLLPVSSLSGVGNRVRDVREVRLWAWAGYRPELLQSKLFEGELVDTDFGSIRADCRHLQEAHKS